MKPLKPIISIIAFCCCSLAFAQEGERRPGPPPDFKKKIDAIKKACKDDIAKLCSEESENGERRGPPRWLGCLMENKDKVSSACKKALDELPAPPKGGRHPRRPPPDEEQPQTRYYKEHKDSDGEATGKAVR